MEDAVWHTCLTLATHKWEECYSKWFDFPKWWRGKQNNGLSKNAQIPMLRTWGSRWLFLQTWLSWGSWSEKMVQVYSWGHVQMVPVRWGESWSQGRRCDHSDGGWSDMGLELSQWVPISLWELERIREGGLPPQTLKKPQPWLRPWLLG